MSRKDLAIPIILLLQLFFGVQVFGQNKMPVVVLNDTTLAKGTYVAENNILVGNKATLRFAPGSHLLLGPGVVIRIEGGLQMEGSELAFSSISSQNPENPGLGLVISEISNQQILLKKVRLHNLEIPIEFEQDWHRPYVRILGSEFKENKSFTPGVFVRVPENIEIAKNCNFQFIGNSYIDNIGGIYFEDVDQLNFKIEVRDNFIFGNRAYGAGFEGMLTSPFFFRCDNNDKLQNFVLENNVFENNFILDSEYDTVIHEVNLGVAGGASKVNISKNYFGGVGLDSKTKNLDHFSNNNDAPFLQIAPDTKQIPDGMPPFVGNVELNGANISNKPNFLFEPTGSVELKLTFKDDVDIANSEPKISYTGFHKDEEKEVAGELETTVQWIDKRTAIFKSSDIILGKLKAVFFSFSGLVASSQFSVPSYRMGENGYHSFIAKNYGGSVANLARFNASQNSAKSDAIGSATMDPSILEEILARQDSLERLLEKFKIGESKTYEDIIDEAERQIVFAKYYRGSFEFGPYIGSSIYFGDFTGNDIFDPGDAQLSLGLVGKYNFTERLTLSSNFIWGQLRGDETDNFRGTSYPDRGFNFESSFAEVSFSMEYNLNKLGFGDQGRFTPALSLGIGSFYFEPNAYSALLLEKGYGANIAKVSLYDYHTAGLEPQYSRTNVCIPFGIHIKSVIKEKLLLDFSFTWRYTFTDFIDDFGQPGEYRDLAYFEKYFPDNELVPNTDVRKADVAFDLHNSLTPEKYHKNGSFRGGVNNDWYIITGVTITYIQPKVKRVQAK